jgi:hypothetical protein
MLIEEISRDSYLAQMHYQNLVWTGCMRMRSGMNEKLNLFIRSNQNPYLLKVRKANTETRMTSSDGMTTSS